jgi:dihydropteroate synthase
MGARSEMFAETLRTAIARRGVALMGVCNVTPDSFSDGGQHFRLPDACARVDELLAEGADFVDIGPESTRPRAVPVPPAEQLARALEVVRYAAGRGACVSIDTTSPEVARACLEAGASAVNDVSCLADEELASVARDAGAALVLMHARGPMAEMKGFSDYPDAGYGDVVLDVLAEWRSAADRAKARGLPGRSLVMDPGLGFAKNARQSTELLRRVRELVAGSAGVPVLVGASRKSFLKVADKAAAPTERLGASIAAALFAARAGASILRVHDVRATRQALDLERLLDHPHGALEDGEPGLSSRTAARGVAHA